MNTLCLDNYEVVELSQNEALDTDGGIIWFIVVAALLTPAVAY